MKRLLCCLCALLLLAPTALAAEKYDSLPPVFAVEVESTDRRIEDNRAYIYKEYLHTVCDSVNAELRAITDAYDESLSPTLQHDPRKNGKRNSRLDITTVYYRTGESWLSTMVLARVGWNRVQLSDDFTTRTYDLNTGERKTLSDLFPADSEAWTVLADGVRAHFEALFPGEARDERAIDALCTPEALAQADFTLSGMELTLHYPAKAVFPEQTCLAHVRFFYPQFEGMMTEEGARQTDNSRWKFVAITCDDGPNYNQSNNALTAFRQAGARVTYFTVGKKLVNYADTFVKQFDQNHVFGSHSYHHWSGYSMKPASRLKEIELTNEMTLPLVGETPRFFRAPGGTYPPWAEAGIPLPIIQWSLDTYDYTGKDAKHIFYSVRNNAQEGDIILCHDTGLQLYKAVPLFAKYLTENGFMMVTVEELAHAQGVTLEPSVVYWRCFEGEVANRPDANT